MNKILQISVVLLLFVFGAVSAEAKINLFPKPRYIPALNIYGDSGKAFRMSDFKSDLLVAVVWSRTCGPCLQDLRPLGNFTNAVRDDGIEVILISPEKEWRTVDEKRNFLRRLGASNIVSFNDRNSRFKDGMGLSVTPTTVLVNKNGEEVGQITGSVKWDSAEVIDYMRKLKTKVSEQLNESESADKQD
ncbi:MAG: TlpA family protein disulfide reductase [Alphaproteobacteria bacterium]|nr:TlpA family protein disulfide reductase [Alphaproteobacteria bacterium]